jgi:hypothetical protein
MKKKRIMFSDLSERLQAIFVDEDTFEGYKMLSFEVAHNLEVYDDELERTISTKEANEKLLKTAYAILGIDEHSTKRDRKRALKKHGEEFFEVSEEIIDIKVETGFKESEFFNTFVEQKNISRGDRNEFWTDENVYLSVTKIAGDHHDFTLQRLGSGESYTVTTSTYGIAVGADIDLYLSGRLDWNKFTDQCAAAFVRKIQNDMYAEVMSVGDKLPAQFTGTGALSAATKDDFDELIEDVTIANDNVPIYIMGTKTALKKLTALADIDWITDDQKKQVADTGRLGFYEGVTLFEIPQRFALNDTTKKLVDSTKLLIMPQVENKFVKFVDVGETEINEITEKGEANGRMDDTMKYEVQRTMGIGTQIGRYFGVWNLA